MKYSLKLREWMYVKDYGRLSIPKTFGNKYIETILDQAKRSLSDAIKTPLKRSIKKIASATGNFTGIKIADELHNN